VKQTVVFGFGAVQRLGRVLDDWQARRVFLVTGGDSFTSSGAARALESSLRGRAVERFCGFTENPKLEDVERGRATLTRSSGDAVVAVGGGSVLDVAKLVNALAGDPRDGRDVVASGTARPGLPLVAIPTTSGSGSEATQFAVVYVGHSKYSVGGPAMRPPVALVDPGLAASMPAHLTAVTGMDAFAQAVESYWCVNSTEDSQRCARRAITLVLDHLETAVNAPTRRARRAMSKAAYLAGSAINVTKTTGPHALSYPMTSHFGVPHGHAVALTLGEFFVYNSNVTGEDVSDRRGAAHVRKAMDQLATLLQCSSADECRLRVRRLMQAIGLQTRLSELGVSRAEAIDTVAGEVNTERMANNPRQMTPASIRELIGAVC